jgi:hypothetical protein
MEQITILAGVISFVKLIKMSNKVRDEFLPLVAIVFAVGLNIAALLLGSAQAQPDMIQAVNAGLIQAAGAVLSHQLIKQTDKLIKSD